MSDGKLAGGEWTAKSAASCATPIIGDIVTEWVMHTNKVFGKPVKTLVYVPTVAYGYDLCRQFNALGYKFEQVSYKNEPEENKKHIDALRNGDVIGLISVEALVKGLDITDAQCLIFGPSLQEISGEPYSAVRSSNASPRRKRILADTGSLRELSEICRRSRRVLENWFVGLVEEQSERPLHRIGRTNRTKGTNVRLLWICSGYWSSSVPCLRF